MLNRRYRFGLDCEPHNLPRGNPERLLKRTIETRDVPESKLEGNLSNDARSPGVTLERSPA